MMPLKRTARATFLVYSLLLFVCGNAWGSQSPASATGNGTSRALVNEDGVAHQCWIFTHLQKCGGSTIKGIVANRWHKRTKVYDSWQWTRGTAFTSEYVQHLLSGDRWDVVQGGYTEALRSHVGDQCKWFITFRHPVSRLVSAYFFCQKAPKDPICASGHLKAKDTDLVTFAKHWGNFAMRQLVLGMVDQADVYRFQRKRRMREPGWYILKRYLEMGGGALDMRVGDENEQPPEDRVMQDMLQPVRDLLRDNFAAVGILESFHETLELFNRALEMPDLDWHSKFEARGRANVDEQYKTQEEAVLAEAWTNAEIKKYINLDLLIYDHAVAIFNEQKERHGI